MAQDETEAGEVSSGGPIILYDGVCGLCHRTVRFLIRRDPNQTLRFAPLQGTTAEQFRATHPSIPKQLKSVVLLENQRVYLRSKAFLMLSRHLRYPWRAASWFRWLPGWVLDPFYWVVAMSRYRLFGKYDTCALPSPDEQQRFLD